jgi:hypothetical protein
MGQSLAGGRALMQRCLDATCSPLYTYQDLLGKNTFFKLVNKICK